MKDWKNMTDQELDTVFKKAAETNLPEFNENSWAQMEKLLDEDKKEPKAFWSKSQLLLGVLLLLTIVTSLYFFWPENQQAANKTSDPENNQLDITSKSTKSIEEALEENVKRSSNQINGIDKESQALIELTEPAEASDGNREKVTLSVTEKEKEASENKAFRKLTKQPSATIASKLEQNTANSERRITKTTVNQPAKQKTLSYKALDSNSLIVNSEVSNHSAADLNNLENKLVEAQSVDLNRTFTEDIEALNTKAFQPFLFTYENIQPSPIAVPRFQKPNSKFGLRIGLSPDLSAIPDNTFMTVGHNYQALIEYQVNPRWQLQTGLIKSQKYYDSYPSSTYWNNKKWGDRPSQLVEIKASCNMIDIPLNLRYNFNTSRHQWFLMAGVTSYLMLNEKYDFVFEPTSGLPDKKAWQGKTGFYSAGVINLSSGYEYQFRNRFSLQIEPFIKLPIRNVGYGNAKLRSAGTFFSLKMPIFKK